ncbi:MAG: RHS repeat-associated core domain-containing protein, partial [Planctomycetaceae bacterium]|nr:RHS repeat-associated core domain-containing protein [Planctomycetaceae bacterium]
FDGHGSTRVLTDFVGAIVELYTFDAYGNAIGFDPSVALTEFLYSGEQFDSKIGQQYLRARYYDPATGRFNRLDPFFGNLNDPQSLHKYLYTHADPVNRIDPSGEFGFALGLGGLMLGVVLNTNLQTISIDCYQDTYDGTVKGLNIFEAFYNSKVFAALALTGEPTAATYASYMAFFIVAISDGVIDKVPTYNPVHTSQQIDAQAEKIVRQWMKAKGFDPNKIITLKNASGHGVDLVGMRNGKLYIFEIKGHEGLMRGSGYGDLSQAQRNVDDFITTRLRKAAYSSTGHWSDNNVSQQVRKAAQEALDHINDGKPMATRMIHVENVFGSVLNSSAKIIYKSWKRLKIK